MLLETARPDAGRMRLERWWRVAVLCLFLLALAIRLASVLARPHLAAAGDPGEYVGQANMLAEGRGWIEPVLYLSTGAHVQTAKLPPLFTLVMAVCSLAGFKSFFAHRVWSAIVGSLAAPVAAGFGKEIGGRRVGLLAAGLVAVYPNLWISDGLAMSETISPILVMVVLWLAYRTWREPTARRAAATGLAIGFAALARDELILLAGLVLLPVVLLARGPSWRSRARMAGVGAAGVVLIVAPWVGYNLSRFSHPVLITDRFGLAVATSNCEATWQGPLRGYWSMPCAQAAAAGVHGDESAVNSVALGRGLRYVGDHVGGLPSLEAVRLGRTFGFYHPLGQIELDTFVEARPHFWALVGLGSYYGLAAASLWGAVVLRRRGLPIFPMVAIAADVVIAVLVTYGQTRFRAPLEPVLVVLASVAAVDLFSRWGTRGRAPASTPAPSGPT